MKRMFAALMLFFLPTRAVRNLSARWRRSIHPTARIGFSFVHLSRLSMQEGSRIGHLNFIRVDSLDMSAKATIHHLNRIRGSFGIELAEQAAIGNENHVTRAKQIRTDDASLVLKKWAKITSKHRIDLTCSITIGSYSIFAGSGSQVWTHGYVHAEHGLDRYRIDGPVTVGSNVYIGSMCFISMGVTIADGVIVGGGTSVARDLSKPALYVSAGLRTLPRPPAPESRADLVAEPRPPCGDIVWSKRSVDADAL